MASTTTSAAANPPQTSTSHHRINSGATPSRPNTPLRPPSRSSLRASQSQQSPGNDSSHPLSSLETSFSELSDSMADLEANMMHLQLLNDSISRFSENFGAFLYGMNMTAFCVDFPEAPLKESYVRHELTNPNRGQSEDSPFNKYGGADGAGGYGGGGRGREGDVEATFMTSDTSGFVENPEPSTVKKSGGKFSEVPGSLSTPGKFGRGRGLAGGRGGVAGRGSAASTAAAGRGRGSGIARGSSTGRGSTRGTGIARGVARGRGVR